MWEKVEAKPARNVNTLSSGKNDFGPGTSAIQGWFAAGCPPDENALRADRMRTASDPSARDARATPTHDFANNTLIFATPETTICGHAQGAAMSPGAEITTLHPARTPVRWAAVTLPVLRR